jgi:hypothetical protein
MGCWRRVYPLKLNRMDLSPTVALKTDGFYYSKVNGFTFMLYKNGTMLRFYDGNRYQPSENLAEARKKEWLKFIGFNVFFKTRQDCGVFNVNGSKISMSFWLLNDHYFESGEYGIIKNDSTIALATYLIKQGYKKPFFEIRSPPRDTFYQEIYHFYPLAVKPDSTNNFIK